MKRPYSLPVVLVMASLALGSVRCPVRAPNCNAFAERFVRSIKEECLGRIVFFGEASLRRAIHQFTEHYRMERNHQGLGNELIEPDTVPHLVAGPVRCRQRLGGLLRYYHRRVA